MKFLHKTFELKKREIIEVHIDNPTKVKFMSGKDWKFYKMGKTHTYYGGTFEESPVRFVVPFEAVWNVVVEKGTTRDPVEVNAKCAVLPPNGTVRTSVAVDAPDHVRLAEASEAKLIEGGPAGEAPTEEEQA